MKTRKPATRLRALDGDAPEARRFSPLNAPQRAAVEAFCNEAAGWAARQARRTYGHLPAETRRQAIDRAMREVRLGAHPAIDRGSLYETLAQELTEQLRQVHAGWCLNAAQAEWRREGPVVVPDEDEARDVARDVAGFVDEGLVGLERAVLQLEIGAGRETRTARAALRLGPRQYERHRSEGLSKLRSAITGHATGRVCDHHLEAVTLAATGDRDALASLSSGPDRCRACAREASGLRRVLQERLALAPWPLAIKPASLVAAKMGFVGALFGGKAGGAGITAATTGPLGSGAGTIAGVLAAAVVATGGAALLDDSDAPKRQTLNPAVAVPAANPAVTVPAASKAAPAEKTVKAKAKRPAERRRSGGAGGASSTTARGSEPASRPTLATPVAPSVQAPQERPAPTSNVPSVKDPVGGAVDEVREAADPVTEALPAPVQQPVEQVLDGVEGTVDEVTGTVDGLLP